MLARHTSGIEGPGRMHYLVVQSQIVVAYCQSFALIARIGGTPEQVKAADDRAARARANAAEIRSLAH